MNIVLIILLILIGIIALMLVVALFIPVNYRIERNISINKPVSTVYNYVRHLRNQEQFSKWVMLDPNMDRNFTGTDGNVGFIYAWESRQKNAGKGEQEITGLTENARVDVEVRFERPFKNVAQTPFTLKATSDDQTIVTWGMTGRSNYPLNLMTAIMTSVLKKDLDESLDNLKNILEK